MIFIFPFTNFTNLLIIKEYTLIVENALKFKNLKINRWRYLPKSNNND